jgi:hypothetical protein
MGDEKSRRECWYDLEDAVAIERLFLQVMLFIAINIQDITTTTALICCGLYGFIVE